MRHLPAAAVSGIAALTLALVGCDRLADLAASNTSQTAQQEKVDVAAMRNTLSALPVEPEWDGSYDRDRWPHWTQQDGCDTREVVMYEQGVYVDAAGVVQAQHARRDSETCEVYDPGAPELEGGTNRWTSPYDGEVFTDASDLDADHVVALGEAADSGGHAWSPAKKERYANETLILAVSASANRSKGDSDPSEWLPPATSRHCRYVARWINVKAKWHLAVDHAERAALTKVIDDCGQTP